MSCFSSSTTGPAYLRLATFPLETCRRLGRGTLREREISSDQMPLVVTIGINEENLRFDDRPRDREKVLSKNFRFLFSILEEGGKKALASKLGIDPTTVSWPRTRD